MKRIIVLLLTACLALTGLAPVLADRYSKYGWDADVTGYSAVVANPKLGDRLNLREKPDTNAKSLGRFYSGTPVYVISRTYTKDSEGREWAQVDVGNAQTGATVKGWMLREYLMPMNVNYEAPQLFHKASARSSTNLLSEPRNGATIVGQVGNSTLDLLGDVGDDWRLAVNGDGEMGYIRASRIENTWIEVKPAYLIPADGGGYVPIYEDQALTKVRAKMYPGAPVYITDFSRTKGWAAAQSFGVPYDWKNEWVWQADISGYVRMEDVTVFLQPWQIKVNLRTGKTKADIKMSEYDGDVIPAGASVTVVGEMKDQYQIFCGDPAGGWHAEMMVPASQIALTDIPANLHGPAIQGFALLPEEEEGSDIFTILTSPGDEWQEGETGYRLAEIIGEVEKDGTAYLQLRTHDESNFYFEKSKCQVILADQLDSGKAAAPADGPWMATEAEQGLWVYSLAPGQTGVLTLDKPDGTMVEYEVSEEQPNETTYAFYVESGERVTVQGEGEVYPLVKGNCPMLLPPYPDDYMENEKIFEGSGRFYCDWQIPGVVNYFTLMIHPLPGSTGSYAAVTNLFGDPDSTTLIPFFPVPEDGWEHEGTVCIDEYDLEKYDCWLFPGMFLEVHNCTVSVFFGNG